VDRHTSFVHLAGAFRPTNPRKHRARGDHTNSAFLMIRSAGLSPDVARVNKAVRILNLTERNAPHSLPTRSIARETGGPQNARVINKIRGENHELNGEAREVEAIIQRARPPWCCLYFFFCRLSQRTFAPPQLPSLIFRAKPIAILARSAAMPRRKTKNNKEKQRMRTMGPISAYCCSKAPTSLALVVWCSCKPGQQQLKCDEQSRSR